MFWKMFESKFKPYFIAFIFSVVVASILNYAVNFHWYYAGREAERRLDAKRDFSNIKTVVNAIGGNVSSTEKAIIESIITVSSGHVTVTKVSPNGPEWSVENDVKVLPNRTIVEEFDQFEHDGHEYLLKYDYGNSPSYLGSALINSWTWSVADLLNDSDTYSKYKFVWRSTPLWSCFLIVMTLSLLLVRELRRRHRLFRALEEESVERVNQGLEREKFNNRRIDNLSADLIQIKSDKDRIEAELASKREDADFLEAEALELEEKVADLGRRYEDVSAKKLEIEEENTQLSEQLETIRQLISTKFNNMKVKNIVEFLSGKSTAGISLDAFAAVDSESKEFRKLLKIISSYVDLKGGAKVNFPDHGTNHIVKEFYNKFDNEFLTKFFCHISSDAYSESNVNRIKVLVNDGDEDGYDGKVNIYIKNGKYGCCLSLRFNKGKKVNTANLGYALALIVKSKFKFLDSYEIKAAL